MYLKKRTSFTVAVMLICVVGLLSAQSDAPVRRFGVFVGANDGGSERITLRWAASDAYKLAEVMNDVGGMDSRDAIVLVDPDSQRLTEQMDSMRVRVRQAKTESRRVELMFYYSGHSDEVGLMLGETHYGYDSLREDIKSIGADVSIAILDSCASGAFTRLKGGARIQPFLVDDATDMSGHAFLTSSSEDEASQESDAIGSSFFTHYIISGLRGGADASRDGRVTLNEIYQYAYNETLARTERTYAGPQHPSYDIQLNGTGDLVLTDITTPSASLRVDDEIQGRLFFRTTAGDLLAEIQKHPGAPVTVALPPGEYRVTLNHAQRTYESEFRLRRGLPNRLSPADFAPKTREYAIPRGDFDASEGPTDDAPEAGASGTASPPRETATIPTLVSLAFVPGIGTAAHNYNPAVALGAVIASHREVNGVMASGVGNIASSLYGGQFAGVFNVATEESVGVQLSGVFNSADSGITGYQGSGVFNTAGGASRAWQSSGVYNVANGDFSGVQASGVFNQVSGTFKGAQASGVFNMAADTRGAQLSLVNVGGDVRGAQIGLVNIGKTVYGAQIGLVNISDDIYGAPVGLINLVENGITDASYWLEGDTRAWVGLQNGSRHFYTLVYAGIHRDTELKQLDGLAAGAGIGARITTKPFFFDMDISIRKTTEGETADERFFSLFHGEHGSAFPSARLLAGMAIGDGLGFFVGGTFDAFIPGVTTRVPGYHDGEQFYTLEGEESDLLLYPKFVIGFKL
jgi:hypothetical protein